MLPSGNGYCRSEAAVVVLLTRKSLARRVYATILNAGTNTDGYKEQGGTEMQPSRVWVVGSCQGAEEAPLLQV